jgi:hypothetical protein
VTAYEEEKKMTYVTETIKLFEEKGIQQGIQKNAREAIMDVLNLRFGEAQPATAERIHAIDDITTLKALHKQAVLAESLEKFQRFMDDLLRQTTQPDD